MNGTTTVHIPLETQGVMSRLLRREKARWTRGVEYGFNLILRNGNLIPGMLRRGHKGGISYSITDPAVGFFHTHPMDPTPPFFSETDTIEIFMRLHGRLSGIGHPDYSVTNVSFIALTKAPPTDIIFSIIDNLPGILDEGVHMGELEEYYTTYGFELGRQPLPMEVLLGWNPPKLPLGWWKPKETIDEFLKRKLGKE